MSNKTKNGPGRPKFIPVIPKGNFTRKQMNEANPEVIPLTITNWIKREIANRRSGMISKLDEKRPAEGGLGAPQLVYSARNQDDSGVAAAKLRREAAKAGMTNTDAPVTRRKYTRKAKVAKVVKAKRKYTRKATAPVANASQTPTADALDKIHAALATPTPELTPVTAPVTVPVADITPAPAPAVVETPAPAAPVAETVTPAPVVS